MMKRSSKKTAGFKGGYRRTNELRAKEVAKRFLSPVEAQGHSASGSNQAVKKGS